MKCKFLNFEYPANRVHDESQDLKVIYSLDSDEGWLFHFKPIAISRDGDVYHWPGETIEILPAHYDEALETVMVQLSLVAVDGVIMKPLNYWFELKEVIARTFIPNDNPQCKVMIQHLDMDVENNAVSNLQWMTPEEKRSYVRIRILEDLGYLIPESWVLSIKWEWQEGKSFQEISLDPKFQGYGLSPEWVEEIVTHRWINQWCA